MRGPVGSKNGTRFNQLKLYNKNIFKFSLDKRNIGCPPRHAAPYDIYFYLISIIDLIMGKVEYIFSLIIRKNLRKY
jgi:hypothetical protein